MYSVFFRHSARKDLHRIPEKDQEKLLDATLYLGTDPFVGKKLHGKWEGSYVLRVWPYRIIYLIQKQKVIVEIVHIGHRQGVYR